jgi:SAM-dependent methyltransferase
LSGMRVECGGCGGHSLEEFLDLGETAVANTYPLPSDPDLPTYPLGLCICLTCGLVQSTYVVPDEEIYGDHYGFYSGASTAQVDYHRRVAARILHDYPDAASIVEIGCNDGSMLRHLALGGRNVIGVEPSIQAKTAVAAGLQVLHESFTEDVATQLGTPNLVLAFNVLAHVDDLHTVLNGIRVLLAEPGSYAIVEVQYLPDMLVGNMIDQAYHEHRYHWSYRSFNRIAGDHGLYVNTAELIEPQGGSLRLVLSTDPESHTPPPERGGWIYTAATAMQGCADRMRRHLQDLAYAEAWSYRSLVGWAAAAKATTTLTWTGLHQEIPYVVDTTPYKQGRLIPGVKVPIVSPAEHHAREEDLAVFGSTRLLLAPNYLAHMLRADREFLDRGGRWLVPTPSPMLV